MKVPDFLLFASDATLVAFAACGLLLVSIAALLGEMRRKRRKNIDAVGIMPWRDIAVLTLFGGVILMTFAITGWLQA